MATNNYYGFTHGGTQYGNQYQATTASQGYTTQYGPAQPGTQPPTQTYAAAPADPYLGYARPGGQVAGQNQAYGYGQGQTYPATPGTGTPSGNGKGAGNGTTPRPATTSTVYPTYSANTANATTSYAGFAQPAAANTSPVTKSFSNYDAAVYSAVTAYAQGNTGSNRGGGLGYNKRSGMGKLKGSRAPPKPQTLHYCDVCKISCAGPQTYKEHLEGQKHKKKEAAAKVGVPVISKGSPPGLRCELCDVTCTGNDAYAAHIRGAKHQKVLKLHTKLGKPIPSDNPTVVTPGTTATTGSPASKPLPTAPVTTTASTNNTTTTSTNNNFVKPVTPKINFNVGTPKINFIGPKPDFDRYGGPVNATTANATTPTPGSTSLANSTPSTENSGSQQSTPPDFRTPIPGKASLSGSSAAATPVTPINVNIAQQSEPAKDSSPLTAAAYAEKDIQPVGQDYIDEVRSDDGKLISFNCKLCECRFNDPNAKEMHMKGRRHRLQYKKKVNPDLVVDVKPSSRQKKNEDRRSNRPGSSGRRAAIDQFPRPPPPLIGGPRGYPPSYPGPTPLFYIPPLIRRSETVEDLYVMAKHADIYPKEEELQAIQKIVSNTEKALKFVSDYFAENEAKKVNATIKQEEGQETVRNEAELQAHRILKGVMRVGHLAKGLLLKGDRVVDLVVLCSEKPTISMLNQVADTLPAHLQTVASEDNYEVTKDAANSSVVVSSTIEPKIQVIVTLTSPLLRGPAPGEATANQVKDDPDPDQDLDKEKCLAALAALRHAKWFQARATSLQSCVIVIRIVRDICQRIPEWKSFPCWAIELLTEKAINSVGMPVSPGDAFRIVLEAVASGIFLPKGNGLLDPCEKESVDAIISMSDQDRMDVTAYGQKALRLISFKKIHEVLGMEVLPRFNRKSNMLGNTRKRRRNNSTSNEQEENEAAGDGKKDKKDENMEVENSTVQVAGTVASSAIPAVAIKA